MKSTQQTYVAFLRGINVGGRHKVPMAELCGVLEQLKFKNVVTLLNSGNVVFDGISEDVEPLEIRIAHQLKKAFGFPIPTMIRRSESIGGLLKNNPFKDETLTKDMRWYVSFLRRNHKGNVAIPWQSDDGSYRIIREDDAILCSVLDLSVSKTTKAMGALEKLFGKDITTRNWNTLLRLEKKLDSR